MVKQNNNKQSKKLSINHAFRGCREAILTPSPGTSPGTNAAVISTGASGGTGNLVICLCPLGLTSTTLGASSYTQGTFGNVYGPPLRGLFNRAVDFQWYRVTRARFVFVGSVASTATGQITLAGYADPSDASSFTSPALVSGANTKSFDLASASTRELSVPVPVDSSWKKCSSILNVPGNTAPFAGATAGLLANINTVGDLAFGGLSAQWSTTTANQELGRFYLDYDVEFKSPIDSSLNI